MKFCLRKAAVNIIVLNVFTFYHVNDCIVNNEGGVFHESVFEYGKICKLSKICTIVLNLGELFGVLLNI